MYSVVRFHMYLLIMPVILLILFLTIILEKVYFKKCKLLSITLLCHSPDGYSRASIYENIFPRWASHWKIHLGMELHTSLQY